MITAIEIENFKGVRDRVRVELKPITLIFGANSSGKSTILQALHLGGWPLVAPCGCQSQARRQEKQGNQPACLPSGTLSYVTLETLL